MIDIIKFTPTDSKSWDRFVFDQSVNGTFLQSRRFLHYHKEGKFIDSSLTLVEKNGEISAVFPACEVVDGKGKTFYSHLGSTYGGPVVAKQRYNLRDISTILETFEEYIQGDGFNRTFLKITPDIFSIEKTDLLQYLLSLHGYSQFPELSSYIDFSHYQPDIPSNFSYAREKQYKKCARAGMKFRDLTTDNDVETFYGILEESLAHYEVKPVHTLSELFDFKNVRLPDIVRFYGVELEGEIVAGAMSFCFVNTNTLHVQYSASKRGIHTLSPMTFLFFGLIQEAKEKGFSKLSWGISTEDKGRKLNMDLALAKESYGSRFSINRTFYKEF